MPFKSKAQMRKFDHLLAEGKISQENFDKWHAETKNVKRLPERIKKKKKKPGFTKGFEKAASAFTMKSIHKSEPLKKAVSAYVNPVHKPLSNTLYKKILAGTGAIRPEAKIDHAIKKYNDEILKRHARLAAVEKGLAKESLDMAQMALIEANSSIQDRVPGTDIRAVAETGQSKGRATRTKGVRNEDKEFNSGMNTKYDTSRGGRRYGYN